MEPVYSGHPWDTTSWLLYRGSLLIQWNLYIVVTLETTIWLLYRGVQYNIVVVTKLSLCMSNVRILFSISINTGVSPGTVVFIMIGLGGGMILATSVTLMIMGLVYFSLKRSKVYSLESQVAM